MKPYIGCTVELDLEKILREAGADWGKELLDYCRDGGNLWEVVNITPDSVYTEIYNLIIKHSKSGRVYPSKYGLDFRWFRNLEHLKFDYTGNIVE